MRPAFLPWSIAILSGAAIWIVTALLVGEREPWDAPAYWRVAYPAALAMCTLLAFLFPQRPWRWVLALFGAQFVTMCLVNGELGSLSPIGLIAFGVIALPGVVLAKLASRRPRREDNSRM